MDYQLFMGGILLPVAPSELKIQIKGQNKTYHLINGEEYNILNPAGLTDIGFDVLLPGVRYPFAVYETEYRPPEFYLRLFEILKLRQKPFFFHLVREGNEGGDIGMQVSLEDYSIHMAASDGPDVIVSVSLKQYIEYTTVIVKKSKKPGKEKKPVREKENAPSAKTYKVKKGDCLWTIAKKMLGSGARWQEIYKLNKDKISNPNLIYPGQVLKLP